MRHPLRHTYGYQCNHHFMPPAYSGAPSSPFCCLNAGLSALAVPHLLSRCLIDEKAGDERTGGGRWRYLFRMSDVAVNTPCSPYSLAMNVSSGRSDVHFCRVYAVGGRE
ncbi:hypothetical protein AVEN_172849-1 [Araneus ventricosus]|uniref:Uncharacterized protein n=1 Tax=Araneus ventricosus TaxID=182803 RepID=A0A4Y2PCL3_ARAVE|nr:hypothetical protein AVEN_172849-1 [Araneus ventricosus]